MSTHTEILFWLAISSQIAGLFASGIIIDMAICMWKDMWRDRKKDRWRRDL